MASRSSVGSVKAYIGAPALSALRLEKLHAALSAALPGAIRANAWRLYLIQSHSPLSGTAAQRLAQLLEAVPAEIPIPTPDSILVVPRPGTVSPWSSKATEILHRCGITQVARIELGIWYRFDASPDPLTDPQLARLAPLLHDRMTEIASMDPQVTEAVFAGAGASESRSIPLLARGIDALVDINGSMGLALSMGEMQHLLDYFLGIGRDPTDVELMMYAQVNSEHCRHKIFNSSWMLDGVQMPDTLFGMIRNTHRLHPQGTLVAYRDNGAVLTGHPADVLGVDPGTHEYRALPGWLHLVAKVETHNHPTAIAPFPGAATGAGGEIRDEAATGRGASSVAGLCGFAVSNLHLPALPQPWESGPQRPARIASACEIMLDGPLGAAAFNNEFGRPNILGFFRTLEVALPPIRSGAVRVAGYHKPIMLAGGVGAITEAQVQKLDAPTGALVIQIGGPALRIGIGGGAASSLGVGANTEELDFNSVQRGNPEMQRRCQEVINACVRLGPENPILTIHDVGAGGLSNAVPELVDGGGHGGRIELRAIPAADGSMNPLELWSNEAQERYVLLIAPEACDRFAGLCRRERCPMAVLGELDASGTLRVMDRQLGNVPVDVSLDMLLRGGHAPGAGTAGVAREARSATRVAPQTLPIPRDAIDLASAARRVLALPAVADKRFLVTIGDRSVGGRVSRDQMVGPWQVPVADAGVTLTDFSGYTGAVMALGERPPVALLNSAAAARLAVAEALTNALCADLPDPGHVKLSANWMAACGEPGQDAALYDAVQAIGLELCPALGVAIPVGKDSLSMKTAWQTPQGGARTVSSPVSLVITAYAPVADVRRTLTPLLVEGDSVLVLVDLAAGRLRLGGSALAQVYGATGDEPPDIESPRRIQALFHFMHAARAEGLIAAYHDRSDGGLFVTLCEMAFASHRGLDIDLSALGTDPLAALFAEEAGAVVQVAASQLERVRALAATHGLADALHVLGAPQPDGAVTFRHGGRTVLEGSRVSWHRVWSETSFAMASLRDDSACALEEYDALLSADPGLVATIPAAAAVAPAVHTTAPRVAVLREQGVNGHVEMAAAFHRAGFVPVDVHMSDLESGARGLDEFAGLAACGGFSYGDVLGAGRGWALSILEHPRIQAVFAGFFARPETFTLGVCNGCQMLSQLRALIPGAEHWPAFVRNRSEQFEARLSLVEVIPSPSILLEDLAGARLPVVVSHGEGRAQFPDAAAQQRASSLVAMRFVEPDGGVAVRYPGNPNGSPAGITGLTSRDGRATILMPHPERVFRTVQMSWHPPEWGEETPWMRIFKSARRWVRS